MPARLVAPVADRLIPAPGQPLVAEIAATGVEGVPEHKGG